ncbi:MAG: RNA methyltransferase [Firmicutes bacterium HGW-Firmicutes-21]|nr:MAG: RNA methyltransferase [Firmicutes bacterium HGW-Firmicutes-21]
MEFVATCLFGLERLAGEDIDALGYKRIDTIDGRVVFEAPLEAIAECNINFRYAERLYIKLGDFKAFSFEDLYQGTKALPWENFIGKNDAFPVKGHSIKSKLFSVPDCQRIIKKAVVDRLSGVHGIKQFSESGIKYQIEFFILNDEAVLMIDTSGDSLHKRGYRLQGNLAPLRETLAAAMVNLSRPRADVILVDPMCGSGTIAIEAALLTTNTAPGINRSFAAEEYPFIPKTAWSNAREKARAAVIAAPAGIYGYDIDRSSIETARKNAATAGMSSAITFEVRDIKDFTSPVEGARGTVITNPPYGERLGDLQSARELLRIMGRVFSEQVPSWQLYIISSDDEMEKHFGRRSDKVRKLYNGMIKCGLYQFFRNTKN